MRPRLPAALLRCAPARYVVINADGLDEATGVLYVSGLDSDDERLTGEATIAANWQFPNTASGLSQLTARSYEVTNEGIAGSDRVTAASPMTWAWRSRRRPRGPDGYKGLTAYVHFVSNDDFTTNFSRLIFPGPGPAVPELPPAE